MHIHIDEEELPTSIKESLERCGRMLQSLIKLGGSLSLNLNGYGGVCVEVEMELHSQAHHESL